MKQFTEATWTGVVRAARETQVSFDISFHESDGLIDVACRSLGREPRTFKNASQFTALRYILDYCNGEI
jgi:hypothetical protein